MKLKIKFEALVLEKFECVGIFLFFLYFSHLHCRTMKRNDNIARQFSRILAGDQRYRPRLELALVELRNGHGHKKVALATDNQAVNFLLFFPLARFLPRFYHIMAKQWSIILLSASLPFFYCCPKHFFIIGSLVY